MIDTVRSGRDREDAVMHHLLCGGLYKPRRRVRAARAWRVLGVGVVWGGHDRRLKRHLAPACEEL